MIPPEKEESETIRTAEDSCRLSSASTKVDYQSPNNDENIMGTFAFGVLLPNMFFAIGYFCIILRLSEKGEDQGYNGMLVFFAMPLVVLVSSLFSAIFVMVFPIRKNATAFIVGSIVPVALLIAEFILVDSWLPKNYQMFGG